MANSINTNVGALVALQNLNATNRDLAITQNRVNTGLKVATAKDNGAIWAVAQSQKGQISALDAVKNSLSRGQSIVDVGLAAGDSIMDALKEMKNLSMAIEAGTATGEDTSAYEADFDSLVGEITKTIGAASFDGVSAFTATTGGVRTGLDATDVADVGVDLAIADLTVAAGTYTSASVDAGIAAASSALQALGTQSKSFERTATFVGKLQDSLEQGVGNLVDADLAKESAKLQSLQTKQQLGVQALSIANQAPSVLLSLFR